MNILDNFCHRDKVLMLLDYMSNRNYILIDPISELMGKNVVICKSTEVLAKDFLQKIGVKFLDDRNISDADLLIIWGVTFNCPVLTKAIELEKPIIILEDGFIRSIFPYLYGELGISFIFDSLGVHFASSIGRSVLEDELNSCIDFDENELLNARNEINLILINEITKYNYGLRALNKLATSSRRKILVLDQAKNDMSIVLSNVGEEVFEIMLTDAINNNPDSDIFVKIHPEQIVGVREGYFSLDYLVSLQGKHSNLYVLSDHLNSIALLKLVDRVYCVSTQMGFEAALCGKNVVVYGQPFYAGWGFTEDKQKINRKRSRTIEEVFLSAYIRKSFYYDRNRNTLINLSQAAEHIIKKRDALALVNDLFEHRNKKLLLVEERLTNQTNANFVLNQRLSERDEQVLNLNQRLSERDERVLNLNQRLSERDEQLIKITFESNNKDQMIDEYIFKIKELSKLYDSISWRLTKPLRIIRGFQLTFIKDLKTRTSIIKFYLFKSKLLIRDYGIRYFLRRAFRYLIALFANTRAINKLLSLPSHDAVNKNKIDNKVIVSFVIPVYDRTDILRIAIDSVLRQSIYEVEVILVTDGSPLDTIAVVNEYIGNPRVKIFNYPSSSGNAVRGRNKGILEAQGAYVAFLDSDDISMEDRVEKCIPFLESGQADVVYGAWQAIIDGTRVIENIEHDQIIFSPDATSQSLIDACIPCQSTVILRKALLEKNGFLKPNMKYREDHELWARLAYHGAKFKSIPHVLAKLRLHEGNNELNFKDSDSLWFDLLKTEYKNKGPLPKKIAFILPGVGISGGIAVVFKHAALLMEAGHDAFVINIGEFGDGNWFANNPVPIYHASDSRTYLFQNIDLLIATGWNTVDWLNIFPCKRKLYFVQSDERRFFDDELIKKKIQETYLVHCEYFTEALWIKKMLREEFGHDAAYVPNGIDLDVFFPDKPLIPKTANKVRVLLEGPIIIPFKGMAESYAAVKDLDCEIWIVSSAGKLPDDWRCDRFFEAVPFDEMRKIYSSCDIFLKMSRVEGFFGPPMEAMACGCSVVVGKVTGYDEYIVNEFNALVVEQGDINSAKSAVERLIKDKLLRSSLIQAGFDTVTQWSWNRSSHAMLNLVNQFWEIDND